MVYHHSSCRWHWNWRQSVHAPCLAKSHSELPKLLPILPLLHCNAWPQLRFICHILCRMSFIGTNQYVSSQQSVFLSPSVFEKTKQPVHKTMLQNVQSIWISFVARKFLHRCICLVVEVEERVWGMTGQMGEGRDSHHQQVFLQARLIIIRGVFIVVHIHGVHYGKHTLTIPMPHAPCP